ncbi:fibrobacter succinogenes major paralogous domain-containing protein [Elizabethkingia meningoseptica]|uniref:fibrobacter succinogenes major paralogous domain-containing protein n=1 Tax=Elizabethkingia meningoseptica TaxID=238 RepID=UPI0020124E51|nr:fibrobacter succinogenes major paralogous domain-containing protein [Elizabethkingia meningoseptica]MCL1676456.1 fibrobacter succinogenes major paralogous domain-containing protein [Elizabethkingia meningoseptica]MCL1687930.1 fibrobacter succinogenes major paralogous domain-containing protein [Elizabethkingia meningoseptica]
MKTLHKKYQSIISSLILVITLLTFILSFLSLSSCRSAEHDNIITGGGIAVVKINLLGTEYANSDKPAKVSSINQKGAMVDSVQRYNVLVSPSSFISAELAPATALNTVASTSKNLNPIAAVSGDPIAAGMKFRVIAYRQSDGSYQTYKDYTIGQSGDPLMLDGGISYYIVTYSYGSTSALPQISTGEMTNLSQAQIGYDDNNKDLMYQKIEGFIPDGNNPNNKLDIKLRHKLSQITTVINSYIGDITEISWANLRPHHPEGVLSLSTGIMSRTYESDERLNFSGTFPTTRATSDPVLINADTGGNLTGLFSAFLTVNNIGKTISLPNSFKITPEYKNNLTINLTKCGAYIGPNTDPANFKEFMCYNLGADTSVNAFTPSAAIHGAKYQWGAQTGEAGRYISQADDQSNSGIISGWNSTSKPDGSWSDNSKTSNDPCPSGYRVPTRAQWEAVIDNNNVERIGSWANDGNYTTALYVRNPSNIRTLMLPAVGYRHSVDGSLVNRGASGRYWSSSEAASSASRLHFHSSSVDVSLSIRTHGFSVRCVAE